MARNKAVTPPASPVNIALFDSSTLVGKGVKSHLSRRRFPIGTVRVFDTGAVEQGGNLTEFDGEAMLAVRPDLDEMSQVEIAFYCGPTGTGEGFLDWPRNGRFVAIDLTQSANRRREVPLVNASVNPEAMRAHGGVLASPHPISQLLSTFLAPLARTLPLLDVVSIVLQPVSELGEEGIEELYRQTVGILNFTEVPQEHLGGVLAFNILPRTSSEDFITQEVSRVLGGGSFPHALRILRVPVFHCHSFLCRVRFAERPDVEKIRGSLRAQPGIRLLEGSRSVTPGELAGQEDVLIGEVRSDPSWPDSLWFWGVTDDLATGIARNAVQVAEELIRSGNLPGRPPL